MNTIDSMDEEATLILQELGLADLDTKSKSESIPKVGPKRSNKPHRKAERPESAAVEPNAAASVQPSASTVGVAKIVAETHCTVPTLDLPAVIQPVADESPVASPIVTAPMDGETQTVEMRVAEAVLSEDEFESDEFSESEPVDPDRLRFTDLGLPEEICRALKASGYEYPTAIQAAMIPAVQQGRDVLGQAQTGTGKTAAFALPLLNRIDVESPETQVLVLTPTRELAIQVADSFERYGQHLRGLRIAPIYGGSAYANQIHALRRGAHIVVGTPGRVMDHMRESRLRIDTLQCLVLDEADEMLRMGFVDDVQWILEQSPPTRQIALFSATMPRVIREIADRHLKNPHVISIDSQQRTASTINQRYIISEPRGKQEALARILEAEDFDGVIIFVKTKIATVELADYLVSVGHSAVALNGDIAQSQRERTIEQLKQGVFNILVATDVAARGLDVQRITHVINYDLPFDAEAYVHRIGRTGRAGRTGEAIVFIAPRQRGFLRELDRTAGEQLQPMAVPTAREINAIRIQRFKDKIVKACSEEASTNSQMNFFEKLIEQCSQESGIAVNKIAAALATISSGDKPFLVADVENRSKRRDTFESSDRNSRQDRSSDDRGRRGSDRFGERFNDRGGPDERGRSAPADGRRGSRSDMETFRVEVGRNHGVKPGNLVGAIANEISLDSENIGAIRIFDEYSTVDLPAGMPRDVFKVLGRAWVVGRQLRISKLSDHPSSRGGGPRDRRPRSAGRR